jgi:hypothetical protein
VLPAVLNESAIALTSAHRAAEKDWRRLMHGYEFYFEKAKRLELELADLKMTCEQNVTS